MTVQEQYLPEIVEKDINSILQQFQENNSNIWEACIRLRPYLDMHDEKISEYFGMSKYTNSTIKKEPNQYLSDIKSQE